MTEYAYTKEQKEKMLEWAEILESGAYKQTTGWGGDEKGAYCCLNVALKHFTGKDAFSLSVNAAPSDNVASKIFGQSAEWCEQFYNMNDADRLTFPQIAEEIRKMVA